MLGARACQRLRHRCQNLHCALMLKVPDLWAVFFELRGSFSECTIQGAGFGVPCWVRAHVSVCAIVVSTCEGVGGGRVESVHLRVQRTEDVSRDRVQWWELGVGGWGLGVIGEGFRWEVLGARACERPTPYLPTQSYQSKSAGRWHFASPPGPAAGSRQGVYPTFTPNPTKTPNPNLAIIHANTSWVRRGNNNTQGRHEEYRATSLIKNSPPS